MKPTCKECGKECENWNDIPEGEEIPIAFCSKKCVSASVRKQEEVK